MTHLQDLEKKKPRKIKRISISSKEKEELISSLSSLISSGIGIIDSLDVLEEESKSRAFRKLINQIRNDIEEGQTFWSALDRSVSLSQDTINLIHLGEDSGNLGKNLELITLQQEKERIFRSRVQSAMLYPIMVIFLTFVIGLALAWLVLPRLTSVFTQLRVDLPLITRILLKFGDIIRLYGIILVPTLFFGGLLVLYLLFVHKKTKFIGQAILMLFGPIRNLVQQVELSRFGYLLGTLIEAGMPVNDAITTLERATEFRQYRRLYHHVGESIDAGETFQTSFQTYKGSRRLFPSSIQRFIATSEQSGNLVKTLLTISQKSEVRVDIMTKNITVILEPILLIIVWLGVIFVGVAVIVPVYGLLGSLS